MNADYRNFFRGCYLRTNGFIPSKPLNQQIFPGDFFQIRNGEMIILGNIFQSGIADPEDVDIAYKIKQNKASWNFSEGVSKPYSGRGHGHGPIEGQFEFSKQQIAFEQKGSFLFKGNNPESIKILNWNQFQQQLIIKLTQTIFSFRELYVVTETVSTSDWTLAISGAKEASLEIATDTENFGLVDIFGHHSAKTIQSHGMEYYHHESGRIPMFYKAKKLVVQDERVETFISELISQREQQTDWAGSFFRSEFSPESVFSPHIPISAQASVLDMLHANELNPNTALLYFRWSDANLDDIEKLFVNNGYC